MVMTSAPVVPTWCQWRHGQSAILVVAPHGGRRTRALRLADGSAPKVNDLHTAELARRLAERLDASFIVNTQLDRNELDLNRLSQVLRTAPWFLQLLDHTLAAILAHHPVAEVLFVHGWNVTQARCDIGIGATLAGEEAAAECRDALTVSTAYVCDRLAALRAAWSDAGVLATYGERYPARHPNNALQLFRRRPARADDASVTRIAAWAAADRVQAVQLEVGVPLRWPGAYRERFITAAARVLNPSSNPSSPLTLPAVGKSLPTAHCPPPTALQFHDPTTDLGVIAGVGVRGENIVGGRLLLLVGARNVALFTGEDRDRTVVYGGPHFERGETGFTVRFDGPMLRLDDGRLYVDLESALAASQLCPATVDLTFVPALAPSYGRVTGRIRLGERTFAVDTYGFSDPRLALRRLGTRPRQTTLTAAFGADGAVVVRFGDDRDAGTLTQTRTDGAMSAPVPGMTVHFDGDPLAPDRFVLNPAGAPPLVARVTSRMAIEQPSGPGHYARITFGMARFTLGGEQSGAGFYEYARRIPR